MTVITICKDRGWCIEECVRSVLRQDYPHIEYLVQDGASRDNTLDVLRKYEGRLRLQSEPDRGFMDAFHKAFAAATGDIFCLVLSDERFPDEGVVSRVVQAYRQHPTAGVIYGDFRVVDADYEEVRIQTKRQMTFEDIFCLEDFISPCAAFVRADALREHGKPRADLRTFFDVVGDYSMWVYVAARYPITYVPGIMSDFMVHPDEASYKIDVCRAYIRECDMAIRAFQSDAYTPRQIRGLQRRAISRLYLNYGNALAGKYFLDPIRWTWKGISTRPRLIFTKAFLGVILKSAGLSALLPSRGDGKRMKRPVSVPRPSHEAQG